MDAREVVREAWKHLEPVLAEQGYELVEVEYVRQGPRWTLRLYIDKDAGVTLDDCETASRVVSPQLDETDVIEGSYVLEVSSPGFDRPVRKPKDFERFAGERIRVKTLLPVDGRRQFAGELKGFQDGLVTVDCDGTTYSIHIENLQKANLDR